MSRDLNQEERDALRFAATRLWISRDDCELSEAERDQALVAIMAICDAVDGEAAAKLLHARRHAAEAQRTFDAMLRDGNQP